MSTAVFKAKTTLGFFYRKKTESAVEALGFYSVGNLYKSIKECKEEIVKDKKQGLIGRNTKPIICKVTIEEYTNEKLDSRVIYKEEE